MLPSNAVYPSRTSSSTHLISSAISAESDGLGQTSRSPQRALGPHPSRRSYPSCSSSSYSSTSPYTRAAHPQATPYSILRWACSPAGRSRASTPCVAAWWCTQTSTCSTTSRRSSGASSSDSRHGSGRRSPTAHGRPRRSRIFGAPAGTSSSDTCSSSMARDQAERCSGGPERYLARSRCPR